MSETATTIQPTWESKCGRVKLWLGDCREVMGAVGRADAAIVDPPYGVNLGNHKVSTETRPQHLVKSGYANYEDTPENFEKNVVKKLIK